MYLVQVNPIPNQIVSEVLLDQSTTLNIYQLSTGLYMDVILNGSLIIGGVSCLNRNLIIRTSYLGYQGDFAFQDTLGTSVYDATNNTWAYNGVDPSYQGLGTQFVLWYLSPYDIAYLGRRE
jgi:hypothetical protein